VNDGYAIAAPRERKESSPSVGDRLEAAITLRMIASRYRLVAGLAVLSAVHVPEPRSTPPLPTMLVVHVVDSASRRPLVNAEVSAAPIRRLTDANGNARFAWPADGLLKIRVRQIGFRYAERTVHRGTSPTAREDTVVVALRTAAFALPQMVAVADVRCAAKPDSAALALSTSTMELLRFGAEQYNAFRAAYPFHVVLNRRTVRSAVTKGPRAEEVKEEAESETFGDPYRPGMVIQRIPAGLYVPVLFVSALADSAFWNRHCFDAKGVETREGRRVIRLDFVPSRGVRETEWAGSAWIDSAASVLRRVDFRLVNIQGRGAPQRYEGYTTFSMPSPFIAVPDSTIAWWWSETKPSSSDDKYTADVLQFLTTRDVVYLRDTPPPAH
jgi:hypothetical protein